MINSRKIISSLILLVFLSQSTINIFALTNKEALINNIDTLKTNISADILTKETLLTQKAYELSDLYDKKIKSLNINPDDVDILLKANKISVFNFRQEMTNQFLTIKQTVFSDIKTSLNELSSLKDEISIGYSEISSSQKFVFDNKIQEINNKYTLFLSGSTYSINNFFNSFSTKIDGVALDIQKGVSDNAVYLSFIQSIKNKYQQIENNIASVNISVGIIEKDILQKLQNNIMFLRNEKERYTQALKNDLADGIKKVIIKNPSLKEYESSLNTLLNNLMQNWQQYLDTNFTTDDTLFLAFTKAKNTINSEKDLRLQIYDSLGNIRFSELSESGTLISNVNNLGKDIENSNSDLNKLIVLYGTGSFTIDRGSILNTTLYNAYKEKYASYQGEIITYIESNIKAITIKKKALTQILKTLELEEEILKWNIKDSMKYEELDLLINNFILKIDNLVKNETNAEVIKKAKILKYKYKEILVNKLIKDILVDDFTTLQTSLNNQLVKLFDSFKEKFSADSFYTKLETTLTKVDKLLTNSSLTNKKRFTLLVVKSIILKNLQ